MKLGSTRSLSGNKPVLKNPDSIGQDPVYWVFSELDKPEINGKWANLTVIVPGKYSGEYPKTFGHYHGADINERSSPPDETYHLIEGEGVLQMQSKYIENGVWVQDKVDEVYLIKAFPGDEILITPKWGHSWSNVSNMPLLSFDDWRAGHSPADYEVIERLKGLAYYLVENPLGGSTEGKIKVVPNPNYKNLPEPIWITAEEFKKKSS